MCREASKCHRKSFLCPQFHERNSFPVHHLALAFLLHRHRVDGINFISSSSCFLCHMRMRFLTSLSYQVEATKSIVVRAPGDLLESLAKLFSGIARCFSSSSSEFPAVCCVPFTDSRARFLCKLVSNNCYDHQSRSPDTPKRFIIFINDFAFNSIAFFVGLETEESANDFHHRSRRVYEARLLRARRKVKKLFFGLFLVFYE